MKVGDLVIVNVPPVGEKHWPSCQGMIVDIQREIRIEDKKNNTINRTWFYVLRSDTGAIEKFHEDWMEAAENGSW